MKACGAAAGASARARGSGAALRGGGVRPRRTLVPVLEVRLVLHEGDRVDAVVALEAAAEPRSRESELAARVVVCVRGAAGPRRGSPDATGSATPLVGLARPP